jgi:predicted transcriptional regulator
MEALTAALDVPPVGVIGAMRQRMPAHIVRLAMVAAIFDQTAAVDEYHVAFGEVMAQYAVDSMRPVFGLRIDDPVAMLIVSMLRQTPDGWMNTTDLKKVTGKEYSRVQTALRVLLTQGVVEREDRKGKGRPSVGYTLRGTFRKAD